MSRLVLAEDKDGIHLAKIVDEWYDSFSQCPRDDHQNLHVTKVGEEIHTMIFVAELIDGVEGTLKIGERLLKSLLEFGDVVGQPDQTELCRAVSRTAGIWIR